MSEHHFPDFFVRRSRWDPPCSFMLDHLRKDPRISLGSPGDHHTITAGFFHHGICTLRAGHIAVSNHRNGNRLFYLTNNLPVCFSAVILLSCPSMDCNGCCPRIFCDLRHLHCINAVVIKAFSYFNCHRFPDCFDHSTDNFMCQLWIFHQCRSFTIFHDFRYRTSHINIHNIKRSFLDPLCHFTHNLRI